MSAETEHIVTAASPDPEPDSPDESMPVDDAKTAPAVIRTAPTIPLSSNDDKSACPAVPIDAVPTVKTPTSVILTADLSKAATAKTDDSVSTKGQSTPASDSTEPKDDDDDDETGDENDDDDGNIDDGNDVDENDETENENKMNYRCLISKTETATTAFVGGILIGIVIGTLIVGQSHAIFIDRSDASLSWSGPAVDYNRIAAQLAAMDWKSSSIQTANGIRNRLPDRGTYRPQKSTKQPITTTTTNDDRIQRAGRLLQEAASALLDVGSVDPDRPLKNSTVASKRSCRSDLLSRFAFPVRSSGRQAVDRMDVGDIISDDACRYFAILQPDCNLVVYAGDLDEDRLLRPVWSSSTVDKPANIRTCRTTVECDAERDNCRICVTTVRMDDFVTGRCFRQSSPKSTTIELHGPSLT